MNSRMRIKRFCEACFDVIYIRCAYILLLFFFFAKHKDTTKKYLHLKDLETLQKEQKESQHERGMVNNKNGSSGEPWNRKKIKVPEKSSSRLLTGSSCRRLLA